MKVRCPNCKKYINLKDGSFPLDRAFSFKCPGCGHKIRINPKKSESKKEELPKKPELYGEKLKKEILSNNNALPPIPNVLQKARELLNSPQYTSRELSNIISLDPAIAARVLKLANSAYFNFNPPIPTIKEACLLLGEQNLMSIIMVAEMSKMLDSELNGYDIPTGNLFYHCIAVAVASQLISHEKMPLLDQDSFSAGLLHDCGKLLLNNYVQGKKSEFVEMGKDKSIKCFEAETILFGFSHADIGFNLLEDWKLPEIQTHAIGYHHHPLESGDNELAYILNIADYIAIQAGYSASSYCVNQNLDIDQRVLDFLEIDDSEINDYIGEVRSKVEEMTREFSF